MAGKTGYCAVTPLLVWVLSVFSVHAQDTTFCKTYDYSHGYETGSTVITLEDGYLVCASGYATEYDGWRGLKLLKTDFEGNEVWKKVYGIETKGLTSGWYGGMVKLDNGYFLAASLIDSGNVDSKGILYRFDEYGDTLWTRVYDKQGYSFFNNARPTQDNGFIAVGVQYVSGLRRYWLMKNDSMGIAEWDTVLPGTGYATTIEVTSDGGYIIGGAAGNFLSDARIIKTDSAGNIEWDRQQFGSNQYGCYWSAGIASDGGYYLWGCWDTIITAGDFHLVTVVAKLDSTGNRVWTNFFNNANDKLIMVYQVKELPDGSILAGGERDNVNPLLASGGWIVKMNNEGDIIWEKIHAYTQDSTIIIGPNTVNDFSLTPDGGLVITGYAYNDIDPGPLFNTNQDFWLLKLDSLGNWYAPPDTNVCPPPCDTMGINEITDLQAKIYPNPATNHLTIELPAHPQGHTLALYNLLGQQVLHTPLLQTTTTLHIALPPGIYLYRITTPGGQMQTGKVVVE